MASHPKSSSLELGSPDSIIFFFFPSNPETKYDGLEHLSTVLREEYPFFFFHGLKSACYLSFIPLPLPSWRILLVYGKHQLMRPLVLKMKSKDRKLKCSRLMLLDERSILLKNGLSISKIEVILRCFS